MKFGGKIKARTWPFVKKHKWSLLLIVLALATGGFFLWDALTAGTVDVPLSNILKKPAPEVKKVRAPLSGLWVTEDVAKKMPVAVVIENHVDARPQSGLNEAELVYETYAEGGITRFLTFFQTKEPKEIGPVRSAREYFVEWAKSYNVPFAHTGGSAEALTLISKLKIYDLNQFALGKYFWRDNSRLAPHNVYTTLTKLWEASNSKKYPTVSDSIPAFVFKDDTAKESRPLTSKFTVNFNSSYAVVWEYNPEQNDYYRILRGVYQTDRNTKERISAKNVVVVFTNITFGTSQISGQARSVIKTIGSGSANFYIDGVKTTGTWKRASQDQIMRFYATDGQEIKLNAGTTWVDIVPIGTSVN